MVLFQSLTDHVFIGDDVYLGNEYPECIEGGRRRAHQHPRDHRRAHAGARPGRHREGGAVIGVGCVVTKSVAPRLYVAPAPPKPMATVGLPLPLARTMEEFWAGLAPLDGRDAHRR
jgi:hypothetical protein